MVSRVVGGVLRLSEKNRNKAITKENRVWLALDSGGKYDEPSSIQSRPATLIVRSIQLRQAFALSRRHMVDGLRSKAQNPTDK
jgi:hypothetical protein